MLFPHLAPLLYHGSRPAKQASPLIFGDDIAFNFDLDSKGKAEAVHQPDGDDDNDELDRAFPGGFTFIRDSFTANRDVDVESDPRTAVAFADSRKDPANIGNGSASAIEGEAISTRGGHVVHSTGKGEAGGSKRVEAPESVDAGWLYSRCGENVANRKCQLQEPFLLCVGALEA